MIQWQTSCGGGATGNAPGGCTTTSNSVSSGQSGADYSAVSDGPSVFVVAQYAGNTMASWGYKEGTTEAVFTASFDSFQLATNVYPTLSVSNGNVIDTWNNGGTISWEWITEANTISGADSWSGAINLASANTEWNPSGQVSASFASFSVGGYNLIGVMWNDNVPNPSPTTNRVRFAVESMSAGGVVNFPVNVQTWSWRSSTFPRLVARPSPQRTTSP